MNYPKILRVYPYRTARVTGNPKYFTEDAMESFIKHLQNELGTLLENHACYELEDRHGTKYFVSYSDCDIIIGDSIVEKRW